MNVDALIDDLEHFANRAPLVERTEWHREAIRRLDYAAHTIRTLQQRIEELEATQ